MSASPDTPAHEEFARWVQEVLNRLYDSPYLRKHPLTLSMADGEHDTLQRVQLLRRRILDAIHALSPEPGVSAQSPEWRAYRILELRYIEGLTPPEVMQQLALSRSYYFREQARMVEALTATLYEQWRQTQERAAEPEDMTRGELAHAESDRLSASATIEPVDPIHVLDQLRPIVASLAAAQGATVAFELPAGLAMLQADRVLLRQALFTAITHAFDVAGAGRLRIAGLDAPGAAGISVCVERRAGSAAPPAERQGVGLDVCARFMATMGGRLELTDDGPDAPWEARLIWPLAADQILLVVDDNQGFSDLFRRYLIGRGWQVIGAADGAQARQVLAQVEPAAIILDVMMPREDGWELLAALRADARTRETPIFICSVLNEPRLAATLGASGYLTKPVAQPELLRALAPFGRSGASPGQAQ